MKYTPIRFGIIGAGHIAEAFAIAMTVTDGHLYAVASRSLEKAMSFQRRFEVDKAYGNYEELLNDPYVDCVYIATPHGLHYEHMKMALAANKPILCEKAFTLNAGQASEIFAIANLKKLFVMEAMWTRFLPTILELKRKLSEGIIGDIVGAEATLSFAPVYNEQSRLFKPELGGGALLDIGIYPITFANVFFGVPLDYSVTASVLPTGVDEEETLIAKYENFNVRLYSSFKENRANDAYIVGTKGSVKIEGFHHTERALIYAPDGALMHDINIPHLANGLEYEIMEVISCLRQGRTESSVMPQSVTLAIMEQMDALRHKMNVVYPQE